MMTSLACPEPTVARFEPAIASCPERELRVQPSKILLATDLGDLNHTFPVAAAQARLYGAEIMVAHVLPDFESPAAPPSLLLMARPEHYVRYAEEVLAALPRGPLSKGLSVSSRLLHGGITEQVELLAEEWQADRIVVGCHGAEKLYLKLLGSHAERIFRTSNVPVLGVGPCARIQPGLGQRTMRILVAVSAKRKAQFLFRYAAMFAEVDQVEVNLLHVVEENGMCGLDSASMQACEGWLRRFANMPTGGRVPSCMVESGPVGRVILETAARGKFDMVVLGNTSASLFAPSLAPSTAFQVLSESPCPVLVVKDEEGCVYGC